ncbi:hypothetical protein [uncultured Roseobacter sp.]|uniref:hypothetical protein n=2 Tax=uncultured Roseobacter sp. TaxID=114847 RepID=UPI0026340A71|nr:hypothetical protein [uncultured Roseobacter sp.]
MMMKQHDNKETVEVDALLKAARDPVPDVPDGLMARVLADAAALQPTQMGVMREKPGLWMRWTDLLGGWQGMGGLVAATCAGVWIGLNPPAALPDAGVLLLGYETADITTTTAELTSFGWDLNGE